MIAIGLLGGFTTYSTFNYETLALFREGAWALGPGASSSPCSDAWLPVSTGIAGARWVVGN